MRTHTIAALALTLALMAPVALVAHEGHNHTVMGTISSIDGTHLMVKATDGKMTMVMLDAKTKITRGKTALDTKALKIGDRVVASGPEDHGMISAETLKLGTVEASKSTAK